VKAKPLLSIIIINHLSEDIIESCLESIASSRTDFSVEVIIVDNPPMADYTCPADSEGMIFKRIAIDRRCGFARACNFGVARATGEMVFFLNPDIVLEPEAIAELYKALMDNGQNGAVIGRLAGPDGGFQATCRNFPRLSNLIASRGSVVQRLLGLKGNSYTLPDFTVATQVEAAAAAMMMIPRSIFDKLGGFDESYFMYLEDTDLCRRLNDGGHTIYFIPDARGTHRWGHSTKKYRFRRICWHHRSMLRYFSRHESFAAGLLVQPFLAVNCFLSLIIEMFTFRQ